jgi:hypothetical protein
VKCIIEISVWETVTMWSGMWIGICSKPVTNIEYTGLGFKTASERDSSHYYTWWATHEIFASKKLDL